jgi:hypothetical protein
MFVSSVLEKGLIYRSCDIIAVQLVYIVFGGVGPECLSSLDNNMARQIFPPH